MVSRREAKALRDAEKAARKHTKNAMKKRNKEQPPQRVRKSSHNNKISSSSTSAVVKKSKVRNEDQQEKRKMKKLAKKEAKQQSTLSTLLVLLDLNGVLVHRPYAGADFTVRPGALELLRVLDGRVELALITSMKPANGWRARNAMLCEARAANDEAVTALLLRTPLFAGDEFHFRNDIGVPCLPLRVPSLEPWRMLRNLKCVFESPKARGHDERSTILCDDTPGKCPLSPANVLLVPSWDGTARASELPSEAPSESAADAAAGAAVLRQLGSLLLAASEAQRAKAGDADVRQWLTSDLYAGHAPAGWPRA